MERFIQNYSIINESIITYIIVYTLTTIEFAILPFLFVRSVDWILEGFKKKKRKTFGSRIKLFVMGPAPQAGPIKDF